MKKINKGIALIITLAILAALATAGLGFMALMNQDKALVDMQSSQMSGEAAIDAAVHAGIWEIHESIRVAAKAVTDNTPNRSGAGFTYTGSDIETGSNLNTSLYFMNEIRPTNSKLNLSPANDQVCNVLEGLRQVLDTPGYQPFTSFAAFSGDMWNIITFMQDEHFGQFTFSTLFDLLRMAQTEKEFGDFSARTYSYIQEYLTVHPLIAPMANPLMDATKGDLEVNIIAYGSCTPAPNLFQMRSVNVHWSHPEAFRPMLGNYVEITGGTGVGQVRLIKQVFGGAPSNSDERRTLDLHAAWTIAPDNTSTYRVFSLVTPIDFNSAPKELIMANFFVLESYANMLGNVDYLEVGNAIDTLRVAAPLGEITCILDFAEWRTAFIDTIAGGLTNLEKDIIIQLFDPDQPKAIWDGTEFEIPRLPIPFTFKDNGYFDMTIESGLKQSETASRPNNISKRFVTVKLKDRNVQSLRRDFETPGHTQHWVSTSDFVPVRNMSDFDNWAPVDASNFQDTTVAGVPPNVIPDAIKSGLYFNFSIPDDQIFHPSVGAMAPLSDLVVAGPNQLFFTGEYGAAPSIVAGELRCNSIVDLVTPANNEAQAEVYLGKTTGGTQPEYDPFIFGDIAIMTGINDVTGGALFPVTHQVLPDATANQMNAGPPYVNSGSLTHGDHQWQDHQTAPDATVDGATVYLYPARPIYTPTLSVWDQKYFNAATPTPGAPLNTIEYRAEFTYPTTEFDGGYLQCKTTTNGAVLNDYSVLKSYSVTKNNDVANRIQMSDGVGNLWTNYRTLVAQGEHNLTTHIRNPKMKVVGPPHEVDMTGNDNSGHKHGRVAFRRLFPTNPPMWDDNDNLTSTFGIPYIRIIAGARKILNPGPPVLTASAPLYQSSVIPAVGVNRYRTMRAYFKVGLKNDGSVDPFGFRLQLEFDDQSSGFQSINSTVPAANGLHGVADPTTAEGYFEWDLTAAGLQIAPESYAYRLTIVNSPAAAVVANHFNALRSTIAITKIEVEYDTDALVVQSLKHT